MITFLILILLASCGIHRREKIEVDQSLYIDTMYLILPEFKFSESFSATLESEALFSLKCTNKSKKVIDDLPYFGVISFESGNRGDTVNLLVSNNSMFITEPQSINMIVGVVNLDGKFIFIVSHEENLQVRTISQLESKLKVPIYQLRSESGEYSYVGCFVKNTYFDIDNGVVKLIESVHTN